LLDNQRCRDALFGVDKFQAHGHCARQCLHFMNQKLVTNVCRLRGPAVLTKTISQEIIDENVPPPLRYACLYWVQHIWHSRDAQTLQNPVNSFIREHFLHWLEVLGLIGRMTEAVEMVALLGDCYVRQFRIYRSCQRGVITHHV
jgi:hypothetical protein